MPNEGMNTEISRDRGTSNKEKGLADSRLGFVTGWRRFTLHAPWSNDSTEFYHRVIDRIIQKSDARDIPDSELLQPLRNPVLNLFYQERNLGLRRAEDPVKLFIALYVKPNLSPMVRDVEVTCEAKKVPQKKRDDLHGSWTDIKSRKDTYGMVGQITFPTDGHDLDKNDTDELDRLASKIRTIITKRCIPVGLTFVGHTDKKGEEEYNKQLSDLRARTVAQHMASKLSGLKPKKKQCVGLWKEHTGPFYKGYTVPRGEVDAVPLNSPDAVISSDRRVDIYSSYVAQDKEDNSDEFDAITFDLNLERLIRILVLREENPQVKRLKCLLEKATTPGVEDRYIHTLNQMQWSSGPPFSSNMFHFMNTKSLRMEILKKPIFGEKDVEDDRLVRQFSWFDTNIHTALKYIYQVKETRQDVTPPRFRQIDEWLSKRRKDDDGNLPEIRSIYACYDIK